VSLIWLAVMCLIFTMFFSAAEMAFIAANRLRLRYLAEEGNGTAQSYLEAFRQPERVLSTAMIGVTICHIVAASAVTWLLLPVLGGMAPIVVTILLTPVMLVVGEIIPKSIAREWATSLILRLYRPLTWAAVLLVPFVLFANAVVGAILRMFGGQQADMRAFVSREELKALLQLEAARPMTTIEAQLIDKIFDLGDTTVREVMVPLVEVAMLAKTHTARRGRVHHGPGLLAGADLRQRETNIVGVVGAKDILSRGPPSGPWTSSSARRTMCPKPSASTICSARCSVIARTWPSSSTNTAGRPAS
jgi:CBS domain containing-hemolysin-like protein